jgi:hypothetical protein
MTTVGDMLLFVDQTTLFVTTVPLLQKQQVQAQLELGEEFLVGAISGSGRIRGFEGQAVIFGATGTLIVDLTFPQQPRLVGSFTTTQTGRVTDAAQAGGHTFLLGTRGIQKLSADNSRIAESIHVEARSRFSRMGRHLVAVGANTLQVVDASPYIATGPLPVATWRIEEESGEESLFADDSAPVEEESGEESLFADDSAPVEDESLAAEETPTDAEILDSVKMAIAEAAEDEFDFSVEGDELALDSATEDEVAEKDLGDVEGWSTVPASAVTDVAETEVADEAESVEWSEENLADGLGGAESAVEPVPGETAAQGWNVGSPASDQMLGADSADAQLADGDDLEWATEDAAVDSEVEVAVETEVQIEVDSGNEVAFEEEVVVDEVQIEGSAEEVAEDDWEYLDGDEKAWEGEDEASIPAAPGQSD